MKVIVQLLCLSLLCACHKNSSRIQPTVGDISESVYASGFVKSQNQYEVFSTVNGIITDVLVNEGDLVDKGIPLLKISNKPSVLTARNAQLAAESAQLSANKNKLVELKMSVDLAKAKMQNDSLMWQRQKNLWSRNIGTRIEFEQNELNYKSSRNSYEAAIIHYNEMLRQLELSASQAMNTYEINAIVAEEYTIKSEVRGKVYSIVKAKGEMVNTSSPIALIGHENEFIMELQVDERDITRIKPNQRAYVTMDSYKGNAFEAIVTAIDPVMNKRTKSFTIEATFIAPPEILYPFLTVEANILISKKADALIIPRAYLLDDSCVITTNKKKRKIVTGLKDYQNVEVLDGLNRDEFILKPEM